MLDHFFFFFFCTWRKSFIRHPAHFVELGSVGFLPTKTSTAACILFCLGAPGPEYSPLFLHICLAASMLFIFPSFCFLFFLRVWLLLPHRFFLCCWDLLSRRLSLDYLSRLCISRLRCFTSFTIRVGSLHRINGIMNQYKDILQDQLIDAVGNMPFEKENVIFMHDSKHTVKSVKHWLSTKKIFCSGLACTEHRP